MRSDWKPQEDDVVDTLIELFIDGCPVAPDRLRAHLPASFVDDALEMRLVERTDSLLKSRLCLFPCYGKYITTDRTLKN